MSARSRYQRDEPSRSLPEAQRAAFGLPASSGMQRAHSHRGVRPLLRPFLICAVLVFACTQAGKAQDVIDRPVTIYVAGTAGGGIDLYARLVGRHIGGHIAGNPTVTVQVMPGAGGIRAANYLAEQAPRDGTAITTFAGGPIL